MQNLYEKSRELEGRLDAVTARLNPRTDHDIQVIADAKRLAEPAFIAAGEHITDAISTESPNEYRRRLAATMQRHSQSLRGTDLDRVPGPLLGTIERQIYADAIQAGRNGTAIPAGKLVATTVQTGGLTRTDYRGDNEVWMAPFKKPGLTLQMKIPSTEDRS